MKTNWKFTMLFDGARYYTLIHKETREKKKIYIHDLNEYVKEFELRNNYKLSKDDIKKLDISGLKDKQKEKKKPKKSGFNFLNFWRKDK